jgi:hypothetical protein
MKAILEGASLMRPRMRSTAEDSAVNVDLLVDARSPRRLPNC